jgi:hypothetical protein
MKAPFSYERIPDSTAPHHFHLRIADADDNRVATSYDEGNAAQLVALLNGARSQEASNLEVREVLERWRGALPVEVVGLILGLDARLQELQA